jgi:hypothetical protein
MFGNLRNAIHNLVSGNSDNSASAPVYELQNEIGDMSRLKEKFREALSLNLDNLTEEKVVETARLAGEAKALSELSKRASKQQLELAKALNGLHSTKWQHNQQAINLANQWQRTATQNIEQMSLKIIDSRSVQESHRGFSRYISGVDKLIKY